MSLSDKRTTGRATLPK